MGDVFAGPGVADDEILVVLDHAARSSEVT